MSELIKPIPEGAKPGWNITTQSTPNGEITPLKTSKLEATQKSMGVKVSYGQGPEGYDRFIIREPNGGGSVTVPYVEIEGELYVGVNRVERSTTGRPILEAPRGFSLPKEPHVVTAKREFIEETGVRDSLADRLQDLGGKPVNINSSYFEANPRKGEGVKFFGLSLKPDEVALVHKSANPKRRTYKFRPALQGKIREANEQIKPEGIRFFHIDLLTNTSDGFTLQAISRIRSAHMPQRK